MQVYFLLQMLKRGCEVTGHLRGQRLRPAPGIYLQGQALSLSYAPELPTVLLKFPHPQQMKLHLDPYFIFS